MEVQVPLRIAHQVNKLRAVLADSFGVTLGKDAVEDIAQRAETAPPRYGTRRLGWTNDRQAFFFPDKVFGTAGKRRASFVALDGTQTAEARMALTPRGSRTEQYIVLKKLRRDDEVFRLILSIVAVSPLLEVLGAPLLLFHLAGPTGIGKTTLLRLGISVYADPDSPLFMVNFAKDTPNFVDSVLGILHNFPFLLDETTLQGAGQLNDAAYRIASGRTKRRLRGAEHDFEAAGSQAYTLTCLMSGERSIVRNMKRLGARARMLEIEVTDSLLPHAGGENLYDFAHQCFGWFGRDLFASVFRTYFGDNQGGKRLRRRYERLRSEMQRRWPDDHGRLHDALAAICLGDYLVACQLASESGDTPKPDLARLRRRAKNFARRMYYRLQRTADPRDIIREMRAIPRIGRWVDRGFIPVKTLQKHAIGRVSGLTKNKLFGFLKTNGVVDKSEPRKLRKRNQRCYIFTNRGRKLLARRKKNRSASAA
jgi:hypothetical protein